MGVENKRKIMIRYKEIQDKVKEWGMPADVIDRDYVLGHFLNSFYSFEENKNLFVFKGGTCLRKCYFPEYRFSEDLDFTLTDSKFKVTSKFLKSMADECTKTTSILFGDVKEKTKVIHDNSFLVIEFSIPFWGANHRKKSSPYSQGDWQTRIELDFSYYEKIITPIECRFINHLYSDVTLANPVTVYSLKEIFTEKIRAFEQRNHKSARDYYDVWFLLQNVTFDSWDEIRSILIEKCKDKNVVINPLIFNDENRKQDIQRTWQNSLTKQIKNLPEFETVWAFLKGNLFQKLNII